MTDPIARLNAALEGRYAIERELGEGGMATVYLANDLKHERKVALKVLKPDLAAVVGAERFLAEIKTTANLTHPHILPLHDSGEADGFLFYVMPHVEGESLRQRLDREHQLPVDDAVGIATNIAEALDYAHRQDVIHRDIKPANVLLLDGKPVISDFGIALAVGAAGGGRLTETGLSLGTPHYMSPEQATGDAHVGAATDIYALGCVLYEMLVGEPPHSGSTPQAVLGKIITQPPPLTTEHRKTVPLNVEATVSRALEKVPADRFRGAAELARALADPGFRHGGEVGVGTVAAPGPWRGLTLLFASLFLLAAGVASWSHLRPEPPVPVARFNITPPGESAFLPGLPGVVLALSPDGQRIVYVGAGPRSPQLWQRGLNDLEPSPIPGTEGADNPVFSPDGASVAFWNGTSLKTVSLLGGPVFTVVREGGLGSRYFDWGEDGLFYFAQGTPNDDFGIFSVPATGGQPERVTDPVEGVARVQIPEALPGGKGLLVTLRREQPTESTIGVVGPDGGTIRELFTGMSARYAASGHIVYATAEYTLMAAPFDLSRLEVTGPSVALLQGIHVRFPGLGAHFALSETGTLVYRKRATREGFQAVWVDRSGTVTEIDPDWTFGLNNNDNSGLALSPDDDRLAVTQQRDDGSADIWIKQLDRGPLSRLTFDGGPNRRPSWSPDGEYLTYIAGGNVRRARAGGTGEVTTLVDAERNIPEAFFSSDGEWLVYRAGSPSSNSNPDIFALRLGVDSVGRALLVEDYTEMVPALSPDGRWLAYVSDETGRGEVYVRPFPDVNSAKRQVSTAGGFKPVWSHSGRELFYLRPPALDGNWEMIAVEVIDDPTFSAGRQDVLFSAVDFFVSIGGYDVTADDQRFVMLRKSESVAEKEELILVLNFFEELKRLVPN